MKTLLHIFTQVHENYNGTWKPKSGFLFTLRVDLNDFMYAENECIKAINLLLEKQSNDHERFTYVSHELIFSEPMELDAELFETLLQKECEKAY
jgi:hypothetical protein